MKSADGLTVLVHSAVSGPESISFSCLIPVTVSDRATSTNSAYHFHKPASLRLNFGGCHSLTVFLHAQLQNLLDVNPKATLSPGILQTDRCNCSLSSGSTLWTQWYRLLHTRAGSPQMLSINMNTAESTRVILSFNKLCFSCSTIRRLSLAWLSLLGRDTVSVIALTRYFKSRGSLSGSKLPYPPGPRGLLLIGNTLGLPRDTLIWEGFA